MFALLRLVLSLALLWLVLNLGYCQLGWLNQSHQTSQLKMNAGLCWPKRLVKTDGPVAFMDTLWQLGLGQGPDHFFKRFALSFSSDKALPSFDCASLEKGNLLFGQLPFTTGQATGFASDLANKALKGMAPKGNEAGPKEGSGVSRTTTNLPTAQPKPVQERGSL